MVQPLFDLSAASLSQELSVFSLPTDLQFTNSTAVSHIFALTDTATPAFLSSLYGIPPNLSVQHGSTQAVAEFYGEFYSESDLNAFLSLSGLSSAQVPEEGIYGDLPNDVSKPGGEAMLDVEYIMALAPNADTRFYSMADYNPNDTPHTAAERNEGFLVWLMAVNGQKSPALVHSLSYGDVEATIFNASHAGSSEYGRRCDLEFLKMGLRGLSVLVSSGDDGIAGLTLRHDQEKACSQGKWVGTGYAGTG